MDNFTRLETKIDRVLEDTLEIKGDLRTHIYRTALAEEAIHKLRQQITPLEKSHYAWGLFAKIIIATTALVAAIGGIFRVFS